MFEGFVGVPDGKIDGTGRISVKPVEAQPVVVDDTEYRLVHTHTLPYFEQRKEDETSIEHAIAGELSA